MADRRRPERERPSASGRSNEYFVPRDGIDREVITADICRYLGNDALVRPGIYENPSTRVRQDGFFITAYRNLTSAMIQDLKQDSARWDQERRQSQSRSHVGYKDSRTHESRQYYGPTSEPAHASPGYVSAAPIGNAPTSYDSGSQFQPGYAQPSGGYGGPQPPYGSDNNYHQGGAYVAGGHMAVDPTSRVSVPVSGPSASTINSGYAQPRTFDDRGPDRGTYYTQPASSTQQYPTQQGDPSYGRASISVPGTYQQSGPPYDSEYPPEPRYPGQGGYGQPASSNSMDGSYSPATANSRRNDRDREPDPRDTRRNRHHGR